MKKIVITAALLGALHFPVMALADANTPHSTNAGHSQRAYYLEQALSSLPKEDAESFEDRMQQAHDQSKSLYDQAHALHDDMRKILTASTFDRNAFAAKSAKLRKAHEKIERNLDNAFADAVSKLKPEERETLVSELERMRQERQAAPEPQQQEPQQGE